SPRRPGPPVALADHRCARWPDDGCRQHPRHRQEGSLAEAARRMPAAAIGLDQREHLAVRPRGRGDRPMAVTSERKEPWVVGFSGPAVEGAASMRSPVFERPEGRYFVGDPDAPGPPPSECSREELVAFEQRGLATLTRKRWRRVPGGVMLYA